MVSCTYIALSRQDRQTIAHVGIEKRRPGWYCVHRPPSLGKSTPRDSPHLTYTHASICAIDYHCVDGLFQQTHVHDYRLLVYTSSPLTINMLSSRACSVLQEAYTTRLPLITTSSSTFLCFLPLRLLHYLRYRDPT
jgi:hypothetical protein